MCDDALRQPGGAPGLGHSLGRVGGQAARGRSSLTSRASWTVAQTSRASWLPWRLITHPLAPRAHPSRSTPDRILARSCMPVQAPGRNSLRASCYHP